MSPDTLSSEITSETIEALLNRRSIRKYADTPVTDDHVNAILGAALRAPTSSNVQAYSVVVVRDPAIKEEIAVPCGNQQHIVSCPVFLAFLADLTRIEAAFQRHGHTADNNNLEMGLVATIDAALVGMSAYVAAESLGIQGVMIGAVRNDPEKIAEILGLPNRVYAVFGMCLGFPDQAPKQKPRMPVSGIVHHDRYDADASLAVLDPYNAQLRAHYEAIGKETTADSWSDEVDAKLSAKARDGLRAALKARGFDFS
ncbi:MAG: NADPH-dependent oxidoreductase [Rhodospirillales bacterium]|nr:NADPH-dependent oxidoreductase [Rhodospirillales bacterium]MBO6788466.1 NADPH-dependent oxidoreductase [Rhodospirillales bacterium]